MLLDEETSMLSSLDRRIELKSRSSQCVVEIAVFFHKRFERLITADYAASEHYDALF